MVVEKQKEMPESPKPNNSRPKPPRAQKSKTPLLHKESFAKEQKATGQSQRGNKQLNTKTGNDNETSAGNTKPKSQTSSQSKIAPAAGPMKSPNVSSASSKETSAKLQTSSKVKVTKAKQNHTAAKGNKEGSSSNSTRKKKNAQGALDVHSKKHQAPSEASDDPSITSSIRSFFADRDAKAQAKQDTVEMLSKKQYKLPPCPNTLNRNNETMVVRGFLDIKKSYVKPNYGGESSICPKGLELLHSAEYLHLDLRRVYSKQGTCYAIYSQFDLKDEKKKDKLVSFGVETTTRCQVFCCLESRSFQLHFYDYHAARIFRAVHSPSVVSTLVRFMLCCFCGSNACGNVMTVYDSADKLIGRIKQCGCCTKRLMMYMENGLHFDAKNLQPYTPTEFFQDRHCQEARLLKFDVFDYQNDSFVRIEQHLHDSYLCKFIYLKTLEPVGYVRRGGSTKLQLDLWRDFLETEKALLIAGAVLMDHLIMGISLEGSYLDPEKVAGITDQHEKMSPVHRSCAFKFFCYNRLRTFLFTFLVASLIALIIVLVLMAKLI